MNEKISGAIPAMALQKANESINKLGLVPVSL